MKNIKIMLIMLAIWSVFWISSANRDAVSTVYYWETTHNPLKVGFVFDNNKTDDSPDYTIDSENLFYLASFSVVDWGCSVSKGGDYIKLTYSKSNSWTPSSYHWCTVSIQIDKDDIKDYVDSKLTSVSEEEKNAILKSIKVWLNTNLKIKLKLTTNSNWGRLSDYTAYFPSYTLKYVYAYKKSCSLIPSLSWESVEKCTVDDTPPNNNNECNLSYNSNVYDCSSAPIIKDEHIKPSLDFNAMLPLSSDVVMSLFPTSAVKANIVMLADISDISGLIPLWRVKIASNWTSNWVKRLVLTVMNSDGTAPLSSDCIYDGGFSTPKTEWNYIPLYINNSCNAVRKSGEYTLSFQYVDAEGYASDEYYFKLKVIPWQVDPNNVTLTYSPGYSSEYDDGYSTYTVKFKLKDKYDNIISSRNGILNNVFVSSNSKLNEIDNSWEPIGLSSKSNLSSNSNWEIVTKLYTYNSSGWSVTANFSLKFNKVRLQASVPYYSLTNGSIQKQLSQTFTFNPVVKSTKLLTWDNSTVLAFNMDIPIKLNVITDDFNNVNKILVKHIKFTPFVSSNNTCSTVEDAVIVPTTGYEDKFANLNSWSFEWNKYFASGDNADVDLSLRVENVKSVRKTDYYLCGTWWIEYQISWLNGDKIVKKKITWKSNLSIKYWWVYIKGQYSNSSKWLYELLRSSSNNSNMVQSSTTISRFKTKLFNKIVKNVTESVRWVTESEFVSEVSNSIKWINYNEGDIKIGTWIINGKSLIYAKWGNVYINWNITKNDRSSVLTIVAKEENWKGWYIYISPNVTNIDAILVAEKWIYPSIVDNNWTPKNWKLLEVVKWKYNSILNNQLVIHGLVISKWNTIWWSIRIDDKYILPGWKEIPANNLNFYKAAIKDLNYLRRYHSKFNKGNVAKNPVTWNPLDETQYGTYPVIIWYDSAIKTSNPYWF